MPASSAPRLGIGSPQITVGLISGGINTNVVPDRIVLRIDRRIIPEENGAEVERDLVALIENALPSADGISVACRRIMLAEPLRPLPGAARLAEALGARAGEVLGVPVAPTGSPLYTDARHYAAAGIPVVLYGAGPRSILEANAHAADEHLQPGRPACRDRDRRPFIRRPARRLTAVHGPSDTVQLAVMKMTMSRRIRRASRL